MSKQRFTHTQVERLDKGFIEERKHIRDMEIEGWELCAVTTRHIVFPELTPEQRLLAQYVNYEAGVKMYWKYFYKKPFAEE
jgi:hypothetical protein